jgi:hypothetical protein
MGFSFPFFASQILLKLASFRSSCRGSHRSVAGWVQCNCCTSTCRVESSDLIRIMCFVYPVLHGFTWTVRSWRPPLFSRSISFNWHLSRPSYNARSVFFLPRSSSFFSDIRKQS